ncbi:MAG: hypothetical protein K0V04_33495 [Deltaproteobacteria bacterium]|nr:hypothetical protein [Deltaproteobacteria bacterium]
MLTKLEISAAALFLLLAASLLALWTWMAPRMWTELDLRVALGALAMAWLGIAWALPLGRLPSDPEQA